MRAVPALICGLADEFMTSSQAVAREWSAAVPEVSLEATAAGNTPGGSDLAVDHRSAVEAADRAIGRLVSVLEHDMDDLYTVAFAFDTEDQEAAVRFEVSGPYSSTQVY